MVSYYGAVIGAIHVYFGPVHLVSFVQAVLVCVGWAWDWWSRGGAFVCVREGEVREAVGGGEGGGGRSVSHKRARQCRSGQPPPPALPPHGTHAAPPPAAACCCPTSECCALAAGVVHVWRRQRECAPVQCRLPLHSAHVLRPHTPTWSASQLLLSCYIVCS